MTKTLLEVVHAKEIAGGTGVYRYVHEKQLRTLAAKRNKIAQHRRKVLRTEMELQRAQARKKKRQRERKLRSPSPEVRREQQEHGAENAADSESCLSAEGQAAVSVDSGFTICQSWTRQPSAEDSLVADNPLPRRSLQLTAVKHKTCLASRMYKLSHARQHTAQQQRADQLFQTRSREFEAMPKEEQDKLKIAFGKVCAAEIQRLDGSPKSKDLGCHPILEICDLIECLKGLGLIGSNDNERKEIKKICQEIAGRGDANFYVLALELVPRVRSRLMEMHTEAMLREFLAYDEDCNGQLDVDECLNFLARICMDMDSESMSEIRMEFFSLFDRLKAAGDAEGCEDYVDFDGFQMLVELVRETHDRVRCDRVKLLVEETGLSSELLVEFTEEILLLYEVFSVQEPEAHDGLDEEQALNAVREYGLMSMKRGQTEKLVKEAFDSIPDGVMCFARFLKLIRNVRAVNKKAEQIELQAHFNSYDKDRNGTLSFSEVLVMFEDLGLIPQCREDQEEMRLLLAQIDANDSGDLDFGEFQDLVQHVTEKLRSAKLRRENRAAKELGFSQKEVAELRESFINLDERNRARLSLSECRRTLTLLHKDMSAEDLSDLFFELDADHDGLIDFEGFLHFMKNV